MCVKLRPREPCSTTPSSRTFHLMFGQVIKDAILYNKDAKMNLGHPFLIYSLCKQFGVPLEDNEAWIHPIKAIMVKKDKQGVLRPEEVYD